MKEKTDRIGASPTIAGGGAAPSGELIVIVIVIALKRETHKLCDSRDRSGKQHGRQRKRAVCFEFESKEARGVCVSLY